MSDTDRAILELLKQQNKKLESIQSLVNNSLVRDRGTEKTYQFRSRIVEVDLSISSLIDLSFKWLIASIPVGIVAGILIAILSSCM